MALGSQLTAWVGQQAALAILGDVALAVSAAGTNQATATLLSSVASIVTTVGAGSGVRLPVTPTISAGDRLHVANHGANALACYPASGGKLSTASANVPAMLAPGKCADFLCLDGTNWTVILSA